MQCTRKSSYQCAMYHHLSTVVHTSETDTLNFFTRSFTLITQRQYKDTQEVRTYINGLIYHSKQRAISDRKEKRNMRKRLTLMKGIF